jgi:hypothetical protein
MTDEAYSFPFFSCDFLGSLASTESMRWPDTESPLFGIVKFFAPFYWHGFSGLLRAQRTEKSLVPQVSKVNSGW